MSDEAKALVERLKLIAAWHLPGGPTPKEERPSIHKVCTKAADRIEALSAENERLREALEWYVAEDAKYMRAALGDEA